MIDMKRPAHTMDYDNRAPRRGSVFMRFAMRSLARNRSRTLVSIVGIALSCALICAIFTSAVTMLGSLLSATIAREGSWQVRIENISTEKLDQLREDSRVSHLYERRYLGSALMPTALDTTWGRYLTLEAWPERDKLGGLLTMPDIVEGRAPAADGEIVLPSSLRGITTDERTPFDGELTATGRDEDASRATWTGQLAVGSTITFGLGQRRFHDPTRDRDRPCLPSDGIYVDGSDADGTALLEWLSNTEPARTYTVVGFFDPSDLWDSAAGYAAFTVSDAPARMASAVFSTTVHSASDLDRLIEDYAGTDKTMFYSAGSNPLLYQDSNATGYVHSNLVRYQGMPDDAAIWGTLYSFAAILAGVVLVASVSLIYNSFAIAISERTRQFGLLASLGASRRQIRHTVYLEALVLAAIGIPFGLVLGLAGTWAVFQLAGKGLGAMVDSALYADTAGITAIVVDPVVLVLAAAIACITVLISAAVPAWRASRISAVDAIRQHRDVKLSRRERMRARRQSKLSGALDHWRMRHLGVPGWIAHRNLTRANTKGRVAVASLAVSVALLITAGTIGAYLTALTRISDIGVGDIEVYGTRALGTDESIDDALLNVNDAGELLASPNGVSPLGTWIDLSGYATSADAIRTDRIATVADDNSQATENTAAWVDPDAVVDEQGVFWGNITITFVDERTWNDLLARNGLENAAARAATSDQVAAVGLNGAVSSVDGRYATRDDFTGRGTIDLFTHIAEADGHYFNRFELDRDGAVQGSYQYIDGQTTRTETLPIDQMQTMTTPIEMVGAATDLPDALSNRTDWPAIILPISSLARLTRLAEDAGANDQNANGSPLCAPFDFESASSSGLVVTYAFAADNPTRAGDQMQRIIDRDMSTLTWRACYLNNRAANAETSVLMLQTVQLFTGCFAAITGAIAVANVFNTLTSSIILRRREFAMLKSCGMGQRAFLRMIALECASYAWRGLAIGLTAAAVVSALLLLALNYSIIGITYELPVGWVALAVGVVVGVLVASVVYALHKTRAASVVETLREDAI